MDSVQSLRFITQKKSIKFINKIKGLTDVYSARKLQRLVVVSGRVMMSNERMQNIIHLLKVK